MAAERTAAGTEFFSAHIERVRQAMAALDVNDEQAKAAAEIEASEVHWSELTSAYFTAMEDPTTESSSSSLQIERTSEVERTREHNLKVAEENVELFRILQEQYPSGFFFDEYIAETDRLDLLPEHTPITSDGYARFVKVGLSSEKPFAAGAQAGLFHAHFVHEDGSKAPIPK